MVQVDTVVVAFAAVNDAKSAAVVGLAPTGVPRVALLTVPPFLAHCTTGALQVKSALQDLVTMK